MKTKEQILNVLKKSYENSRYVLFGEQCGTLEKPSNVITRYAENSGGHKPAVLGIDFNVYGFQLTKFGEGSPEWNEYLDQVADFADQGGIVTASSHLTNPFREYGQGVDVCRGEFGGEDLWEELLTEGTEINKKVKSELVAEGHFLLELQKRGVTVLFRPLHEANGGWFWFCARSHSKMDWLSPEYLRRFWKYIYNLYVNEIGLTNLIWVYGPNVSGNNDSLGGVRNVLYYYPGDEYVDMVGVDWYTNDGKDIGGHSYDLIMSTGKIAAITEFGPNGAIRLGNNFTVEQQAETYSAVDAVNTIKNCVKKGYKIAYTLTWGGIYGAFYRLGKAKEALDDPFCIDLERLNKLYE